MRRLLALPLSLLPLWGLTQTPTDSARTGQTLDEIPVTAARLPARLRETTRSISVVDSQQLRRLPILSIDQALQYTPGVDLQARGPFGAQADVSIRGGTFNQVLVLLNGVPLPDPQTGHFSLNLPMHPNDLARVEILRGQAANVFGLNAFSGAVNFVTRQVDQPYVRVSAVGGEFGLYDLNVGAGVRSGNTRHLLSAARRGTDGHTRGSDLTLENLLYQGQIEFDKGTLQGTLAWTDRAFGAWRYYQANPPDQYETNESLLAHLAWQSNGPLAFRPEVFWRRHRDDYRLDRFRTDFNRNQHLTDVFGLQLNSRYASDWGVTAVGADFRRELLESTNLGNNERTNAGLFVEHTVLAGDFTIRPSVYTNWFSPVGWNVFPALDLGWQATDALRLYANAGRSFRVPTYTELFLNRRSILPAAVQGNDKLAPEDAWGVEVGGRFARNGWYAQTALYWRDASQMIDLSKVGGPTSTEPFVFRNVTDVTTQGAELNLGWQATASARKGPALLAAQAGWNTLYLTRDPGLFSRYVFNYLRHQVVTLATVRLYGPLQATATARYLTRVGQPNPFWLVDARVLYQARTWSAFVEGSNLTDTRYIEIHREPAPVSWLRAGVTYTWTPRN